VGALTGAAADQAGPSTVLGEIRTAEAFAEMCRLPLTSGADIRYVLARAVHLVGKAVPACDGASITLGPPADPEIQATDNELAQAADGTQLQAAEGPCLTAYAAGSTVVCDDLGLDPRWQRLAPLLVPLGVRAVLGCALRTDRHVAGVLTVYAGTSHAFSSRDRAVASLLASSVLAVVQETRDRQELTELSEQLREALRSRAVIDQAKGILMSRDRLGPDQAFARLVAASRRGNIKVREVARLVVEDAARRTTGEDDQGAPLPV
jgi:GAF domain-containing protein